MGSRGSKGSGLGKARGGHEGGLLVGLEEILANHPVPQEGEIALHQHCLQWRWGALDLNWDIVARWKEYLEDLLNPTDTPSIVEAEAGDSEDDSFMTKAEVTQVVRKRLSGKAPGVDEIHPEYFRSLDVVWLSWLTCLCSISWHSGTVPLDWQTRVLVPLFKKGDRRMCSNYRGITLLPRESLFQGTGEGTLADS